jgi:lipoprotein-releasing system permease protein
MNYKLCIGISRSLLLARWKQTLVAAIGVTFSITMFIALLSFMSGLNNMLDSLVVNRTPHIRIYNEFTRNRYQPITVVSGFRNYHHFISSVKADKRREEIYNSAAIIHALRGDGRVAGVSPEVIAPAFFNEGVQRISAIVNGIDPETENRLFHFGDYVIGGRASDLEIIPNSVILGKPLAQQLLVNIGDIVYVTTVRGEVFPLKLVACYESGFRDMDKTVSFTSTVTAQKMLGKTRSYFTEIHIKLRSIDKAPQMAKEYSRLFETQATDIQSANAEFKTGNFIRSLISYLVGITLLIVAGFGIYNILNMMIYEKMDSIAILKATGFSSGDVRIIFLFIALTIGFFGGTLGLVFGFLSSRLIDTIPFVTAALPTVKTYPVDYNPAYYIIGIVFSLFTTYLAGIFPAAKAGRIDPVIIIRGK